MTSRLDIIKSNFITGFEWCGDRLPYPDADIKGDTFPMTWADDGEIYTSAGDPLLGRKPLRVGCRKVQRWTNRLYNNQG